VTALRLQIGLLEHAQETDERRAAFDDVREGIDRLQRLVEQLLQLSRAAPGEREPAKYPVELGALVRDTVVAHARTAARRHIDLGADIYESATVPADPHELRVLLNNLVRNALHYAPAGSKVDVSVAIDRGAPMLRVIDNGPGIDAADRERVFDRFFRGDGEHVRDGDPAGSGLGLAIVKAIAQRHGASVSLHDAPGGRGLDVRIRFAPAAAAAP
jgi:signal transduction histidine kinase